MEPSAYIPAYLERVYVQAHPDLTPAARELVHDDIRKRPEKYAADDHARALISYERTRAKLLTDLERLEGEGSDEAFEEGRNRLFDQARIALEKIAAVDHLCVDARLLAIILSDTPVDVCLGQMMELERRAQDYLVHTVDGFSLEAPHFWENRVIYNGETEATLTLSEPVVVGWLHTLEAISQLCLSSARYRAAEGYARQVMRARGYESRAEGTVLLALARLEDEDAFFELARQLETPAEGDGANAERQSHSAANALENSPWYLLARTLLLYKTGKMRPAARALREFAARCDGGAFFLLNPTYLMPYLPVRPQPRESWSLSHQAVYEADGIIVDTPDFPAWAESVDGITALSEAFAERNGF